MLSIALSTLDPNLADQFWKGDYCVQTRVKTPAKDARQISAEIDGLWQNYDLVSFPPAFWNWNKTGRNHYISIFREILEKGRQSSRKPQLSGPHNGVVATYGACREDSRFAINNAIKGMGFIPNEDFLPEMINTLETTMKEPFARKLDILSSFYAEAESLFAHDRLASLELYSEPGFNTQSFINQMLNPACAVVWMDIPTFKIKCIVRLLDPQDPMLSEYERGVTRYINLIHSYFHGEFPKEYIASLYFNVEIYDSSPGKKEAKGCRIA
jgi:hypothetical protein